MMYSIFLLYRNVRYETIERISHATYDCFAISSRSLVWLIENEHTKKQKQSSCSSYYYGMQLS